MANPDFYGPELKTERAEHHINELEAIFEAFVRENRKAFVASTNDNRSFTLGAHFPRHTPTVIGDAIHNLRAALDHAYCLLVEANGHTIDRHTKFPFGGDRQSVRGSIDGSITAGHGPSDRVRDVILDTIQPFTGGNGERLYGLHKLDITDKHEVLIPTATKIILRGVKAKAASSGTPVTFETTISTTNPKVQKEGIMTFLSGSFVFEPNQESKIGFDIGFQQGQPFEGESIIHTLRDLLVFTNSALKILRTA